VKITQNKSNSGFTLIEILAATSILVMLMLAATSMLMTTVMSQAKGSMRAQVKDEGAAIMQRISYNIRNASQITSACAPDPGSSANTITYENYGTPYTFGYSSYAITLGDGVNPPVALHTSAVKAATAPAFTCTSDAGTGNKFITIDFTLTTNQTDDFKREGSTNVISEDFSSSVQFRNYQAN